MKLRLGLKIKARPQNRGKASKLRLGLKIKVSKLVYNFAAATVDGLLRDRDIREPDSVTIPTSMLQYLEEDARVLTMIGSFLDCLGFSANSLLYEVGQDPTASQTMRQLLGALSGLEKSRGKAAGHMLSAAIMLDTNLKLIQRSAAFRLPLC